MNQGENSSDDDDLVSDSSFDEDSGSESILSQEDYNIYCEDSIFESYKNCEDRKRGVLSGQQEASKNRASTQARIQRLEALQSSSFEDTKERKELMNLLSWNRVGLSQPEKTFKNAG